MTSDLPDDLRIPLHELQADARSLIMRVATNGSFANPVVNSVETKLSHVAEAAYRLNGRVNDQAAEITRLTSALAEAEKRVAETACDVIDGYHEFDQLYCCDGRMCGCEGQSIHQMMKHFIRANSAKVKP